MHAAILFQKEFPDIQDFWYNISNYVALLSTENEESLKKLLFTANVRGIKSSAFTEPDLNNSHTAIAFEPNDKVCKLCSSLPLAFKEYTETFNKIYEKEVASGN